MELLLRAGDREVWLHRYEAGAAWPVMDEHHPLLLWTVEVAPEEEAAFAVHRSTARYVVCGGDHCEGWHDLIDTAWAVDWANGLDPALVMTTWHSGESVGDVVFFFVNSANFDDYCFKKFLIVTMGAEEAVLERLAEAVRRELGGEAEGLLQGAEGT